MTQVHHYHGTYYAYRYGKCRCDVCLTAAERRRAISAAMKAENARLKGPQWRSENRDYRLSRMRQWREQTGALVAEPKRGHWSEEEDAVILRDDIGMHEKAVLLGRNYRSCANRLRVLRHGDTGVCEHCGQQFYKNPSEDRASCNRFCSSKCHYQSKRQARLRPCEQCGEMFLPATSARQFCSLKCFGASITVKPQTNCPVCGVVFKPKKAFSTAVGSTWTEHCSMRCAGIARRQRSGRWDTRTCPVCGKKFVPKDPRSRTCSRICGSKARTDRST